MTDAVAANGWLGRLRPAEWQLALPLTLAFAAFFLAPLGLLAAVSVFDDDALTRAGFAQWAKFLGDPFYWSVVGDTLGLGLMTVAATALVGFRWRSSSSKRARAGSASCSSSSCCRY